MLRHLVHMGNGFANLGDTQGLLVAGCADFSHEVCHAADAADHLDHGSASLIDQQGPLIYTPHTVADESLDFFGRVCTAASQ